MVVVVVVVVASRRRSCFLLLLCHNNVSKIGHYIQLCRMASLSLKFLKKFHFCSRTWKVLKTDLVFENSGI